MELSCYWAKASVQWAQTHLVSQQTLSQLPAKALQLVSLFQRPRVRLMLGLLCAYHGKEFLEHGVCDVSQNVHRCQARVDGRVGAFASTSRILVCRTGRVLLPAELVYLMGFNASVARRVHAMSDRQLAAKMVGNSMHVPTMAILLLGLLSCLKK